MPRDTDPCSSSTTLTGSLKLLRNVGLRRWESKVGGSFIGQIPVATKATTTQQLRFVNAFADL